MKSTKKKTNAPKYFSGLNYSMANEDSSLERALVKRLGSKRILSVCGSGARALSLLQGEVTKLDCVDLSMEQLSIAKLRLAIIKSLEHDEYLKFWGYAPHSPKDHKPFRREVLEVKLANEPEVSKWIEYHQQNDWESLLYKGKWESSFATFGKITQTLLGPKALEFFQFNDLESQKDFLKKEFPWKRWNLLVKVIGNRATFNALLYKGDFIKKNVKLSYFDYYSQAFKNLFNHGLAKENFFLQLCMLGAVRFPEGNIIEADLACFQDMKKRAQEAQVSFIQEDVISQGKQESYDFISISDVPSYFSGKLESDFLQDLYPKLESGGVIVLRSYLRIPDADRTGYTDISSSHQDLIETEKTQMYKIEVLRKA